MIEIGESAILPDAMNPCGKRWFQFFVEAKAEIEHMHSNRGPQFRLNAYFCFNCDGYHIGHTRIFTKEKTPA